ncbi:hypothetical protein CKALI_04390 [Corynebacterium kalinowskii]|uniref:SWIM-type domain-containing protein n=1 Tax=Corynebacterium kalinowskii TaxID=2675216 RepID=A0A6B8VQB6_9CORY|nr:hypothetical protein [Corynebacterium kalinowskii]QGU01757.1 hypothetical protein CKALI_04390 [Corynebacterium kalinowskii]
MNVRARKDNVIYANFGNTTRVDTPPPARKRREVAESHQQAFIRDIFHDAADEGRISRGKAYARNGNVVAFDVQRDRVIGAVAGSQLEPFHVEVVFPHRDSSDIGTVTSALLGAPGRLEGARHGRLTPDMVTTLLADAPSDVRMMCDCPDRSLCCKHAVAVLDTFADKVAANPALLFELRGLNFAQLEQSMQEEARTKSEAAASPTATATAFWDGGSLPALPNPKIAPAIDDADGDALHKAMRTVSYTSADELRAISDLEDLYDFLVRPEWN